MTNAPAAILRRGVPNFKDSLHTQKVDVILVGEERIELSLLLMGTGF